MCVYVSLCHMCTCLYEHVPTYAGAQGSQKQASGLLELELQVSVSCQAGHLEEPHTNHGAISPALFFCFKNKESGTREVAQWVKVLATKPDNLNSVPWDLCGGKNYVICSLANTHLVFFKICVCLCCVCPRAHRCPQEPEGAVELLGWSRRQLWNTLYGYRQH